ncbi:MAG: M1 family metallopeptidase, partial [Candidatus Levyibacteriota bacterium]
VLDLIAIPDFAAGAMENWGAVTFRETAVLVDEGNTSLANKQWVALVIAHELAHMWFGDLVTLEWWTHLWLNEGFALYIEYVAVNKLFPDWDIWTQFLITEHNEALALDGLDNTHAIEVPVKHPSEISEIFDEVSYAKGASVIQMLAAFLGEKDFRDGLRKYLKKHAYQNAQTEDLWHAFETVSKKPVKKIMSNWTKKAGYPLVTVKLAGTNLSLSQKRYFTSSMSAKNSKDRNVWHIPFTLSSKTVTDDTKYLMDSKAFTLSTDEWIKINSHETSFFRVKYPKEFMASFSQAVLEGQISVTDRLGILRDAFDLAQSGYAKTSDALLLTSSYKNETDYAVWAELSSHLHRIHRMFVDNAAITNTFPQFAKHVFDPIAQTMGWEKRDGEKHTDVLLRSLALYGAGTFGNKDVVAKAQGLFGKPHLDPDIRTVIYTLVAENGGEKEFDTFVSMHKNEPLHQEKDRIARAITAFRQKEFIQKALDWSMTDAVRLQDKGRVLYAVFANPHGRELAWEFVKKHWEFFKEKLAGAHGFSRVIGGADVFTTEEKAKEIEAFFAKHAIPEISRTVKQIVESIYANVDYVVRDSKDIADFLQNVVQ